MLFWEKDSSLFTKDIDTPSADAITAAGYHDNLVVEPVPVFWRIHCLQR